MKIVFFGATKFSEAILLHLIEKDFSVDLILTIPKEFNISYSEKKVTNYYFSDLAKIANDHKIPYHFIDSKKGSRVTDFYEAIKESTPDLILVMGWYYMVPEIIRNLAKLGAWGIHSSLLPDYAGGAPLVWAMIEGQEKTGVTLFRLEDGVDDGDIIAQGEFEIGEDETIKEVYDKAIEKSKEILIRTLKEPGSIKYIKQDKSKIKVYPQRKPEDGEIDLSLSGKEMYNFIRAQASPYPGAFIKTHDNKKIIIEKARLEE